MVSHVLSERLVALPPEFDRAPTGEGFFFFFFFFSFLFFFIRGKWLNPQFGEYWLVSPPIDIPLDVIRNPLPGATWPTKWDPGWWSPRTGTSWQLAELSGRHSRSAYLKRLRARWGGRYLFGPDGTCSRARESGQLRDATIPTAMMVGRSTKPCPRSARALGKVVWKTDVFNPRLRRRRSAGWRVERARRNALTRQSRKFRRAQVILST